MKRTAQYVLGVLLGGLLCASHLAFAATGFVTEPMWMSPESPKEGDMVTIGTVFLNSDSTTISGTVVFNDGNVLLAKKSITIAPNQVGTASATFIITAGDHSFSAEMDSITERTASGTTETINTPDESVKLPEIFIPKKVSLGAQASGDAADASEQPILNQINTAEQNVLKVVPPNTKNSISKIAETIDAWRASTVPKFQAAIDAANARIKFDASTQVIHPQTVAGSKDITVSNAPNDFDSPFAYVKKFFFTVLTYLFATSLLFYFLGALLVYFILRFIFRRIYRSIRNRSIGSKLSKKAAEKH